MKHIDDDVKRTCRERYKKLNSTCTEAEVDLEPDLKPSFFDGIQGHSLELKNEVGNPALTETTSNMDQKPPFLGGFSKAFSSPRNKTGQRMKYEAEVSLIQRQIGSLEKVRADLGLSARKICQLLLVDPSAWNRWSRPGGQAPPHIWRALQWYFIAHEKLPGLTPNYFLDRPSIRVDTKTVQQVQGLEMDHKDLQQRLLALEAKADHLFQELQKSQRTVRVYESAGTLLALILLGFVAWLFLRARG